MLQVPFLRNRYGTSSKLIEGVPEKLYFSLKKGFQKNDEQLVENLNSFCLRRHSEAVFYNSLEVLNQFNLFPYFVTVESFKYSNIGANLPYRFALHFQSLISHGLNSRIENVEKISEKQQTFFDDLYTGFLSLIHPLLGEYDPENDFFRNKYLYQFKHVINEFNNTKPSLHEKYYDYEKRFKALEEEREAFEIIEKSKNLDYPHFIQRQAALALKSWLFFLFKLEKIDEDHLLDLEWQIKVDYQDFESLLFDVITIREGERNGFLGLSGWDHTERYNAKIYSPPSVYHWILYGMVVYLIRNGVPDFIPKLIEANYQHNFLAENVQEILGELEADIGKWLNVLGNGSTDGNVSEKFYYKSREILNIFLEIRVNYEATIEEEIQSQKISAERIKNFKDGVAKKWKRSTQVIGLFENFYNFKYSVSEDFKGVDRNVIGSKMMFVEKHHQEIIGLGDLGGEAGRTLDSTFVHIAFEKKKINNEVQSDYNSVSESIDHMIQELHDKGFEPNLIIIPPEFSYKSDLYGNANFSLKWTTKDDASSVGNFGSYKNIPVTSLFTRTLSTQIIVAEFEKAFCLRVFESQEFYYGKLSIEITELSKTEINKEYEKNPDRWRRNRDGIQLTDDQAKTKIANTLNFKIGCYCKFEVEDERAYEVSIVKV